MAFMLDDSTAGREAGRAEPGDHRFQFRIPVRSVYFSFEFCIKRYRIARYLEAEIRNPGFTSRGDGGKASGKAARRPERSRDSREHREIGLFESVGACKLRVGCPRRAAGPDCSVALGLTPRFGA